MPDFTSFGVSPALTNILREYGIVTPTPIQERVLPSVMEGRDILAQAQTGTGKTFAFILPILEKIIPNYPNPYALIVTPTRELAIQITEEVEKLIINTQGINVLAVYGGQDVQKQLKELQHNVQIIVGTPGRLLDLIERETLQLNHLKFLVLDEADQMLHIGFLQDVESIMKDTPEFRQTLMFSATIPEQIRILARHYMRNPEIINIEIKQVHTENIKQIAIHTTDRAKQAALIQLLKIHRPYLAVIFCRTKRRVSKLYEALKSNGLNCEELHGDLSQTRREHVMKNFRNAKIQLLIATDVAARGIDVDGITHVFNYDIPQNADSYVHRIGRTGRAGTRGIAITLYSSKDRPILDIIEKELNFKIPKKSLVKTEQKQKNDPDVKKRVKSKQKGTLLSRGGDLRRKSQIISRNKKK